MRKSIFSLAFATMVMGGSLQSCQKDDVVQEVQVPTTHKEVISNYVNFVFQNYSDAHQDAIKLKTAIYSFVDTPNQANFDAAKTAWLNSRESYGTTEAFRFIDGPIDDANGPEAYINSWPMDENFIDYTQGLPNSGIINDKQSYPVLTKELLKDLNEFNGGEKNISIGFHAIEFLLWGQDLTAPSEKKAGLRPYTDYVVGGTAANQARRGQYLKFCADLLVDHLNYLVVQWKPSGVYRAKFLAMDEKQAIAKIFKGAVVLVKSELAEERVYVALSNKDQEDEHSCFSDNTHRDVRLNLAGVINVYKGNYKNITGKSLRDLITEKNPALGKSIDDLIFSVQTKTELTATPFDFAISGGEESLEGIKVLNASKAMKSLGSEMLAGAFAIGVTVE